VDHLVIPLDASHAGAVGRLAAEVASAAGLGPAWRPSAPHITVVAHVGLEAAPVVEAVAPVIAAGEPFSVHAHGYGVFAGGEPSGLSLHVPVVRSGELDDLHRRLHDALRAAGAEIAGWCTPETWSPHITLADRELEPATLGAAVARLVRRPHPSWRIPVDRVALTGGWADRHRVGRVLRLEGGTRRARSGRPSPGAVGTLER
jgi:2'-5' RNA ligase